MGIFIVWIFCLIVLVLLLLYMVKEAFANRVIYDVLEFSSFPKSFGKINLFFISDIHRRKISDKIIDQLQGKVDLVIIGGDLTESGVPFQRIKENILQLKKLGTVFFVWGNNDYEVNEPQLDAMLLHLDVKVLVNSSVLFESETGDRIFLVGVDDLSTKRADLEQALRDTDPNSFKIFVSHNPEFNRKIKPEHGINLMLSGHTHGGQIRLFGFGPYEKGTLKRENNQAILISNGYGTTGVPLRLGAKSETHLLTIQNEK
jgi:uncharacterized protein